MRYLVPFLFSAISLLGQTTVFQGDYVASGNVPFDELSQLEGLTVVIQENGQIFTKESNQYVGMFTQSDSANPHDAFSFHSFTFDNSGNNFLQPTVHGDVIEHASVKSVFEAGVLRLWIESGGFQNEFRLDQVLGPGGGDGGGDGGGSSTDLSILGEWIRGNGIVYEITNITEQNWYYLADRSNGGFGEIYFRETNGSQSEFQVGYKNANGIINPSANSSANITNDGQMKRLNLQFPNGQAVWAQPVANGGNGDGNGDGNGGGNDGGDGGGFDDGAAHILAEILQKFDDLHQSQNDISDHLNTIKNQTGGLDSDDDVPTLQEILAAIQSLDSTSSDSSTNGSNIVQGTRNDEGEFEELEQRLEDMNIGEKLQQSASSVDGHVADLESGIMPLEEFTITVGQHLDGSRDIGTFMIHKPSLERRSPIDDYGGAVDLFSPSTWGQAPLGMTENPVPDLADWSLFIKTIISIGVLWWYIGYYRGTIEVFTDLYTMGQPTAPITNYGGSLGGLVDYPLKAAVTIATIGVLGVVIALVIGGQSISVDGVETNVFNHFLSMIQALLSGAVSGSGTIAAISVKVAGFLDMFLPASLALTLYAYAVGTRLAVRIWFFGTYATSRALS
tara:strand:+ start:1951 stop:3804 length:1854 start_codon:yes stop_codon:yes gene_type:complete